MTDDAMQAEIAKLGNRISRAELVLERMLSALLRVERMLSFPRVMILSFGAGFGIGIGRIVVDVVMP